MKLLIVARYTFLEIYKSRILLNVFLLSIGLALVSALASALAYGIPSRVSLDLGMGLSSLSSIGIAIFLGVGLIQKEIEARSIHLILSHSISRISYLFGKILGMLGILFVNVLMLSAVTLGMYLFLGGVFSSMILWSFLFTFCESILVLLLVVMFSLVANQVLAVLFTIGIYACGYGLEGIKDALFVRLRPAFMYALTLFEHVIPNFYKLNVKDYLLYEHKLPLGYLTHALFYFLMYAVLLSVANAWIFSRKNLD